ncbi:GNAT family N-acetyltransferase [Desulfosporosinus fructosivorans]
MIKLEVKDYFKVVTPLESLTINTLFAKAVIYKRISGSVYVDSDKDPKVFYIVHPYGMSLLFGDTEKENFNEDLFHHLTNKNKIRNKYEWLQAFPNSWNHKIESILDSYLVKIDSANQNRVLENTRVNFIFNIREYKTIKGQLDRQEHEIVRTTNEMLKTMPGSVIPKYFWDNEDQFQNKGIGFSLIYDGEAASTAFSSCRFKNELEIGIETLEKYRRKGFALYVCSALINYCIENGLEPIWACRMENIASYQLALKLGFIPTLYIPYYRLSI